MAAGAVITVLGAAPIGSLYCGCVYPHCIAGLGRLDHSLLQLRPHSGLVYIPLRAQLWHRYDYWVSPLRGNW